MIYGLLFCGLPILGVIVYIALFLRMGTAIRLPLSAPLPGVIFVGTPRLIIQSVLLRRGVSLSTYHRFVIQSGFLFPRILGALILLALIAAVLIGHI